MEALWASGGKSRVVSVVYSDSGRILSLCLPMATTSLFVSFCITIKKNGQYWFDAKTLNYSHTNTDSHLYKGNNCQNAPSIHVKWGQSLHSQEQLASWELTKSTRHTYTEFDRVS